MDEKPLGIDPLTESQKEYLRNYREYSFFSENTEYSLVYQAAERPTGDSLPFCFCLNKATGKFLNVVYEESSPGALDPWRYGGLSAVTTVGRYLIMASNKLGPGYTTNDRFATTSQRAVAWVRGGTYNRTYTITVTRASDGQNFTASYTTMTSSYPTLLDTSDIPQSDPEYQKKVNDRVNAYNSAVNKWIGDASNSIQPQNIATQLANTLSSAMGSGVSRVGSTIVLTGVSHVSVSDNGDGSMFRAVHNEVDDPAKLSTIHLDGKVVRVRPQGTAEEYYMVAKRDQGSGWGTVTWSEGPAQVVTPGQVFAIGTVSDDGQSLIIADSPAQLASATGLDVPEYAPSVAGGIDSKGGVPYFFGRRITLLTVFMDRLVIVSNGVVFMSRVGDYFNWFRASMLRLDDDDPLEAYALGAEDDVISRAVTYNRDLFMFGERNQYTISGKQLVTPSTVSIATTAGEKGATMAQPIVVGNLLFYGKYDSSPNQKGPSPYSASVSQFQLGLFEGTPETYLVSQQLDKYLRGRPIQFASLPSPYTLFLRTDGNDYGLYVYRFIDQPGTQSRVHDSWSRWEWHEAVGRIIGITSYEATLFVFTIRENAQGPWVALEQFVVDADLSVDPYLDAKRSPENYAAGTGFFREDDPTVLDDVYVVASQGSEVAFLGDHISNFDNFYTDTLDSGSKPGQVGVEFEGCFIPTAPFVRDQNDKALVNGRLVVNRYTLSITDTSGMDAYRQDAAGSFRMKGFNGRRVGLSNNLVGRQPVSTAYIDVACGRANTEHKIEIKTRRWLPLTVSAIEWVGQLFNNARRV
ncbi:phage tail protein [Pusillimonas sp.]|uniref:phage nozzle protein n=1 Tax=Pusillimonas sp. TaxID=3040095 RepID=UPI0037C89F24